MVSCKEYNLNRKYFQISLSFLPSLSGIIRHPYINPPYTPSDLEFSLLKFPPLAFFRNHQTFMAMLHLRCITTLWHHNKLVMIPAASNSQLQIRRIGLTLVLLPT